MSHEDDPSRHSTTIAGYAMERILARLLRVGSLVAASLLVIGLAGWLCFRAPWADRVVMAGLLVLLLTPLMRVLVAGLVFLKAKDWLFACFCLVVLCSLLAGVKLGLVD